MFNIVSLEKTMTALSDYDDQRYNIISQVLTRKLEFGGHDLNVIKQNVRTLQCPRNLDIKIVYKYPNVIRKKDRNRRFQGNKLNYFKARKRTIVSKQRFRIHQLVRYLDRIHTTSDAIVGIEKIEFLYADEGNASKAIF